jgi:Fe-Mn family superoxide dismutase
MSRYSLPDLPYDYGALEPHVSGRIMELHHGKHHAAHVRSANAALDRLEEARGREDFTRTSALEQALAFNLSGHLLHAIFWQNLSPRGGGRPEGELARAIARAFGSFERFKWEFDETAGSITGSGWAALVWEPLGAQLLITHIRDNHPSLSLGAVPLMVVDAWEHAYYLQYTSMRGEFFEALWSLWNWPDISARFEAARRLDLGLSLTAR